MRYSSTQLCVFIRTESGVAKLLCDIEANHEYMADVTKKYRVDQVIKFGHEKRHASWDEQVGKWRLSVKYDGRVSRINVIFSLTLEEF